MVVCWLVSRLHVFQYCLSPIFLNYGRLDFSLIMCFDKCSYNNWYRHQVMKKINRNSFEAIFLNANTSHSLFRFLFWFSFYFSIVVSYILYPNYNLLFLVEINIFESKKKLLVVQSFWTKNKFEAAKNH